jgi:uncharacterized membrane protein
MSASRSASGEAPAPRLIELDVLRGLAVVLMIGQHLTVWLVRPLRSSEGFIHVVGEGISGAGGLAAPLFLLLAGIGAALHANSIATSTLRVSSSRSIRRGFGLLAMGYALSFATPNWFSWQSWYILHLLGFASLTSAALDVLPARKRRFVTIGLIVAVCLCTPGVQAMLDVPHALSNREMAAAVANTPPQVWTAKIRSAARIALVAGHFSILPWMLVYWLGRLTVDIGLMSAPRKMIGVAASLLAFGLLSWCARFVLAPPAGQWFERFSSPNVPFFPASVTMALTLGSLALLCVAILRGRPNLVKPSILDFLSALGRISLTVLLVHVVLFRELTRPMGLWRAVDPYLTIVIIAASIYVFGRIAERWMKFHLRFSAEWLLRKL